MQTIKTWYKYAPDILGKKLAKRKQLGGVIPKEQREVSLIPDSLPTESVEQPCASPQ